MPLGSDTDTDEEEVKTMQTMTAAMSERYKYTGTTNRKPCLQSHVTMSKQITKGKKTANELLEIQTEQMVELLDLSSANFDKVVILRAGYADPIQANLVMGNTATGRVRFDDLDTVLHRGLAIFAALGEGVGDKREARRKISKLEWSVVQGTERAKPWLMHYNAVFDISGIPESEYRAHMIPACNATVHPSLKDSAVDDLIDILHITEKARALRRECTKDEICEIYIERGKFLWDKLAPA